MRGLVLMLALCSCAHGPKNITFTDDSQDSELGWVCVPLEKKRGDL